MAMTSPAKGIADLLVAANVGVAGATSGWSISLGKLPTSPDTAIACTSVGGSSPFPNLRINLPSVQVMVRGAPGNYLGAENKSREVVDKLLGLPARTLNNDFWSGVRQLGDVISLGFDEKNRPIFSCNFSLIVQPASGDYRQAIS